MKQDDILRIFPRELRGYFTGTAQKADNLNEIRLRCGRPVMIIRGGEEFWLTEAGEELPAGRVDPMEKDDLTGKAGLMEKDDLTGKIGPMGKETASRPLVLADGQMEKLFSHICMDSPYAYEQDLRKGYLTLTGGHRVGVAGQVIASHGQVESIRNIRFLNIRITHECIGCADPIVEKLYNHAQDGWRSAMLIGPPACGKTTLLRDLVRQISDGVGGRRAATVGLVDERSEIAGCYLGVPQNQVGQRTDVMDCCPKVCGMEMLLRSMSPQVIAVDEIGGEDDVRALLMLVHSGIRLLVSVHGARFEEVRRKAHLAPLFTEECFERFVLLGSHYTARVLDIRGNEM